MDALKYDLKDTYIVRFNQKETEIAMTTNNLQVFYGNKQAFFDGNMQFPKNRITALIGASGSGKSTFLRSLNRMNDDVARVARILGASPRQVTTAVVIPSAMSWILASLHVSFGFALVGAVVGEFLGAKQGMGLLISTAQGAFNASGVFAAMILLAAVARVADFVLTRLETRLLKWRPAAF